MKIKIKKLQAVLEKVITQKYYTRVEAKKIIEVLLYAELAGKNTQGVLKLFGSEPIQNIQPKYKPKIKSKSQLSAVVDGGGSAGPLPAQMAVDKAITLAKKKGFGIVGMKNTFSSVGAVGFYARKMAQHDLIGMVFANSSKSMTHFGGIEPVYGTNPLAFGFPTQQQPIVFDMAASAITWYGLVQADMTGKKLPKNVALDKKGNMTTDPRKAMAGALLPFANSYKGSGLGMVVEMLAGVWTGAQYVFEDGDWGTTFIAMKPDLLMNTAEFKKRSSDLVRKVKASRTKPGQSIHIPGYDNENTIRQTLKAGVIEIDEKIVQELMAK